MAREPDYEPMIDVPELSRRLNIPERTIYDMVHRGDLPYYRWGRRGIRFEWSQVKAANKRQQMALANMAQVS